MTPEESIYLNDIKTYVYGQLEDGSKIYITSNCRAQFYEALLRMTGYKARITYGRGRAIGSEKYQLIVDYLKDEPSAGLIMSYKDNLSKYGFVVVGSYNRRFIQRINTKHRDHYILSDKSDRLLEKRNLYPIFREPTGKFSTLNTAKRNGPVNKFLSRFGKLFPNSKVYSPYIILIYQLGSKSKRHKKYKSSTSLSRRLYRISTRGFALGRIYSLLKSIVFGYYFRTYFRVKIIPSIPRHRKKKGSKTIVIAMTYLSMGGVERVMLNILKGINRKKFSIHIITTVPHTNIWHDKFKKYADSILHVHEVISEDWPVSFIKKYVEEYVSVNDADVLFITNSSAAYMATPEIKKRIPNIRIYDLLHTHGTPRDNDAYLKISIPFDKCIDKRIVIDEYLKDYYANKYPVDKNKIYVIYNGIDKDALAKAKINKSDAFFGTLPREWKTVTYIGRLEEDKSPTRLVDIAIKLKERVLKICIVVVGSGVLGEEMITKAKKYKVFNKYIYFYGSTDDPLLLDRLSDFTLIVSNAEGIPLTALESMSVSTPVISSAVGGVPEIIDHMSDGFLVQIMDKDDEEKKIDAFTETVIEACSISEKRYKSMQAAAKRKITTKFSSMAEIYEHLLETNEIL